MRTSGVALSADQQAAIDALEADTPSEGLEEFATLVGVSLNIFAPILVESPSWEEPASTFVITVSLDAPTSVETPTWSA